MQHQSTFQIKIEYTKFNGSYKPLNDLDELHISTAHKIGIQPMQNRNDNLICANRLVRLSLELDVYRVDRLIHFVSFGVNEASRLMIKIVMNFRYSLVRKKLPTYKLIVTNMTLSQDDVAYLANNNTKPTIYKKGSDETANLSFDRLKLVLAEVLHYLRQREQCYVLYESQQASFI